MNEMNLCDEWAWSQIEAAADGSLEGANRDRMAAALRRDARLRGAVGRARAVHAALRTGARERPPPGLLTTLLAVPRRAPRRGVADTHRAPRRAPFVFSNAVAAAFLVAIVVADLFATLEQPGPTPDPRLAAVQDFELALAYMSRSAAVTGREVGAALNGGLAAAVDVSRESLSRRSEPGG